jgi:hypothetical protein
MNNLKKEHHDVNEQLKRDITELQGTLGMKQTIEEALGAKLEHIKKEKNS